MISRLCPLYLMKMVILITKDKKYWGLTMKKELSREEIDQLRDEYIELAIADVMCFDGTSPDDMIRRGKKMDMIAKKVGESVADEWDVQAAGLVSQIEMMMD